LLLKEGLRLFFFFSVCPKASSSEGHRDFRDWFSHQNSKCFKLRSFTYCGQRLNSLGLCIIRSGCTARDFGLRSFDVPCQLFRGVVIATEVARALFAGLTACWYNCTCRIDELWT
jgi:hypothetical protein